MQSNKIDLEQLLEEGKSIRFQPQGYSMYPVLVPERDEVIVEPVTKREKLKRGDVVVYRRLKADGSKGILVVHRIWRIAADGVFLVGDNQSEVEGPLLPEQVKGIMVAFIRKGRYIEAGNPLYRFLTGIWLLMRPIRPVVTQTAKKIKRFFVGKKQV